MKVLYVVNAWDNKVIDFRAVQVMKENEKEFEILDRVNVENYIHVFPKEKLYVEFKLGYVTDKLDKEALKIQIDRIYNKVKEQYYKSEDKEYSLYNDKCYKSCLNLLDVIVPTNQIIEKNKKNDTVRHTNFT